MRNARSCRFVCAAAAALLTALVVPVTASAGWKQPVGGASPINQADNRSGESTSLASIGGVPYVGWSETDGTNRELRVARFNGTTNSWEQPWTGVTNTSGGINQSSVRDAFPPSLASVSGVPYVAWVEPDGTNQELRVARLNVGTNTWEQPWAGVTDTSGGINQSSTQSAEQPSLASIGGVPHVAWVELDGTNRELRVARLTASTWGQPWTGVSATEGTINTSGIRDALRPSLADLGGEPWVAWAESDGSNQELRVARPDESTPTWEQPWTGQTATYGGINQSAAEDASAPSLALIGGLRYVAWLEHEATNLELRVARLGTNTWDQPATDANATYGGINQSTARSAEFPSLASIGGVPHLAWPETDGTNRELRVARLKVNAWGQPWAGVTNTAGGINQSSGRDAKSPSLASIGGVPWVAWGEPDGTNDEARVSRLEPEFTSQSAVPSVTGATLRAGVRSYGLPYPVGFQFGSGLGSQTSTTAAPAGSDNVTITRQVGGLSPSTRYQVRPFATAGVPSPRVLGTIGAFTTLAAPTGGATPTDAIAAVFSRYLLSPSAFPAASRGASIVRRRRRTGTRVSYRLSEPATVTFRVERAAKGRRVRGRCRRQTRRNRTRRRCVRYVTLRGSFKHLGSTGRNRFRFTGRLRGRKVRRGRYRLRARAVDAAGNASPIALKRFRIVRR